MRRRSPPAGAASADDAAKNSGGGMTVRPRIFARRHWSLSVAWREAPVERDADTRIYRITAAAVPPGRCSRRRWTCAVRLTGRRPADAPGRRARRRHPAPSPSCTAAPTTSSRCTCGGATLGGGLRQATGVKRVFRRSALGASAIAPSYYLRCVAECRSGAARRPGWRWSVLRPSHHLRRRRFRTCSRCRSRWRQLMLLVGADARFQLVQTRMSEALSSCRADGHHRPDL